jgi:hypothetical protein
MDHVPTTQTDKLGLPLPVPLVDMSTCRTSLGSIGWFNQEHRNSSQARFISNEFSKLAKGPFAQFFSLLLPNRALKAVQVFDGNGSKSVLSSLNDLLGYNMIGILLKASFSPGQLFEVFLG